MFNNSPTRCAWPSWGTCPPDSTSRRASGICCDAARACAVDTTGSRSPQIMRVGTARRRSSSEPDRRFRAALRHRRVIGTRKEREPLDIDGSAQAWRGFG